MSYFDQSVHRRGTHSFKYSDQIMQKKLGRSDVQPLWVADMDFLCPPPVIEAVKKCAERGLYGYSTSIDDQELFSLVLKWYSEMGLSSSIKDISYSPGVVNSIFYLLKILCEPGDGVIVQNPVYGPFRAVVKDVDCVPLNNQLVEVDGPEGPRYEMDYADLEEKAALPTTKAMILCSPSNPAGRVWSMEELSRMEEICRKHNVFVISDEIHADLTFPGVSHIPWASVAKDQNWALLVSPSKTFNIPGLGTSFAIFPISKLKQQFEIVLHKNHGAMENAFGLAAAKAAYSQGRPWLLELQNYLQQNYQLVRERLPREFHCFDQQGTYLAWIDFRSLGNQKDIEHFLYEERGLGLQRGLDFGPGGAGFMRLNYAIPRQELVRVLNKM